MTPLIAGKLSELTTPWETTGVFIDASAFIGSRYCTGSAAGISTALGFWATMLFIASCNDCADALVLVTVNGTPSPPAACWEICASNAQIGVEHCRNASLDPAGGLAFSGWSTGNALG